MANALAWVNAGSGPSYLLKQDFESAGTPSGWTSTGNVVFHNTVSPLEGTGDVQLTAQSNPCNASYTLASTISECWFVALIKCVTLPTSQAPKIGLYSSGNTEMDAINISSAGAVRCFNRGLLVGTMANSVVAGTLYYFKMYYKKGASGTDSLSSYELSTSGTWINSGGFYFATTTGAALTDIGIFNIFFNDNSFAGDFRADHIRLSATDLGNSFSNWP